MKEFLLAGLAFGAVAAVATTVQADDGPPA